MIPPSLRLLLYETSQLCRFQPPVPLHGEERNFHLKPDVGAFNAIAGFPASMRYCHPYQSTTVVGLRWRRHTRTTAYTLYTSFNLPTRGGVESSWYRSFRKREPRMPREPHETMMKTVKSKTDDHEGEENGREGKKNRREEKRRKTKKRNFENQIVAWVAEDGLRPLRKMWGCRLMRLQRS